MYQAARPKLRVAVLANVIAPCRVPLYNGLAKVFDLHVLYSTTEGGESTFDAEVPKSPFEFVAKRVRDFSVTVERRRSDGIPDKRRIHVNPAFFLELCRRRPDAVISTELGARTMAALAFGRLFRRPVWVWSGGTLQSERSIGLDQRIVRRLLIPRIDHWISYGAAATDYLISERVDRDAIVQIQNCVDEKLFSPHGDQSLSLTPRPVMLLAGQFIDRKGIDLYLDAAARMQAKGHAFSSVLVGRGPDEARLQAKCRGLRLKNVTFISAQPQDAMPGIYRSADALIFATREDIWGRVVNEAMHCGLPVLSSVHAGATSEVVPEANWFDPLKPADFDRGLELAISGRLQKEVMARLRQPHDIVRQIASSIIERTQTSLPDRAMEVVRIPGSGLTRVREGEAYFGPPAPK